MGKDDEIKDSFYLRIMRNAIGQALRNQYDLNDPLPDELLNRLLEIYTDMEDDAASENEDLRPKSPNRL
jgi:hypothetical protein